eukprot:GEMP01029852.1.p1 GENE.GEMP01029852.1~~GEMP01029852.1.p1  ORF type:complete len:476 (+),score=85.36 GEMP01029852.1:257-1684(+)
MTHPGPHDSRLQDLQSVRETIVYQARPPVRGQRRLMKESQMQPASPQSLQRGPSSLRTTIALQPEHLNRSTDRRFFENWPEFNKPPGDTEPAVDRYSSAAIQRQQLQLRLEQEQQDRDSVLRNYHDAQRRARLAQLSQVSRQQSLSSAQHMTRRTNSTLQPLPLVPRTGREQYQLPDRMDRDESRLANSVFSPRVAQEQVVVLPEEMFTDHASAFGEPTSPLGRRNSPVVEPAAQVAELTSPLVMSPRVDAAHDANLRAPVVVKQPIWKKCFGEVVIDMETGKRRRRRGVKMCTRRDIADLLLALVGIAVTMTLLSILHYWIFQNASNRKTAEFVMLVSSFGGAVTMVFFDPTSPMSQPWSLLIGHALGGVYGVAGRDLDALRLRNGGDENGVFTVPLVVVMLTATSMYILQCWHPPAVSYALVVYFAQTGPLHALRYWSILLPGLSGAGIIVLCALCFNNAMPYSWRHYPVYWI